jgi:hypothetical protein
MRHDRGDDALFRKTSLSRRSELPDPFIKVTEICNTGAQRNSIGLLIVFIAAGYLLLAIQSRARRKKFL